MCKICSSKVEERPTPAAPKMPDDKVMLTVEIKDINENLQEVTLYDKHHNVLMSYNQPKERK